MKISWFEYKESNLTNQREGFEDYKRVALFSAALKFNWIDEGMEFEYNSSEWKGVSSFACCRFVKPWCDDYLYPYPRSWQWDSGVCWWADC